MTWTNQTLPSTSWDYTTITDITDVVYDADLAFDLEQIIYDGEASTEASTWNKQSTITTSWS